MPSTELFVRLLPLIVFIIFSLFLFFLFSLKALIRLDRTLMTYTFLHMYAHYTWGLL